MPPGAALTCLSWPWHFTGVGCAASTQGSVRSWETAGTNTRPEYAGLKGTGRTVIRILCSLFKNHTFAHHLHILSLFTSLVCIPPIPTAFVQSAYFCVISQKEH